MAANWVAVGVGSPNNVWSTDGVTWNDTSGSQSPYNTGWCIATDGHICVAGVEKALGNIARVTIQYSTDGKSWKDTSGHFSSICSSVAYGRDNIGNPLWVALGENTGFSSLKWSENGIKWEDALSSDVIGSVAYSDVEYGSGTWIAVNDNQASYPVIQRSTDGKNWSSVSGLLDTCYSVAYGKDGSGNPLWVIVGQNTSQKPIQWSDDGGLTWNLMDGTIANVLRFQSIFYNENHWVAGGIVSTGTNIFWSSDGKSWQPSTGSYFNGGGNAICMGVACNGQKWIAVGNAVDEKNIFQSDDGKNWYDTSGSFSNAVGARGRAVVSFQSSPLPCFLSGTRILTPVGYKRIEDIRCGDNIITSDGRSVQVSVYNYTIETTEKTAPYKIPAGALGNYTPSRDLHISGNHAIQVGRYWQITGYLAQKNPDIQQHSLGKSVTYYHIECPNYLKDNLVAEGVTAESLNTKVKVVWKRTGSGYIRSPEKRSWFTSAR